MPFTFAHPAAVLPIHTRLKRWISFPALVIGSMVPDAAYYLPLPAHYKENAHTFLGALSYGLPVGIVVLLMFYWVAPDVVYLLPSPYREVLQPAIGNGSDDKLSALGLRQVWLAICGLAIGAETHILWDSFTHDDGWAVLRIPFLQVRLAYHFHIYSLLEWLSSVVGLCIVLYFCDRWMTARGLRFWTLPEPSWRLYLWLGVLAACLAEAVIESHTVRGIARLSFPVRGSKHFALILFTSFVRDLLIALIALPVAVKTLRSPSRLRDTVY